MALEELFILSLSVIIGDPSASTTLRMLWSAHSIK